MTKTSSIGSYGIETNRLQFLIRRDGIDGALDFAKRTLKIYRSAVVSGVPPTMRRTFIESYIAFKIFIKQHD